MDVRTVAERARQASVSMARAGTEQKDAALRAMARRLETSVESIVAANAEDIARARGEGMPDRIVARLRFGPAKVAARALALEEIATLPDPVGEEFCRYEMANGMAASRVRVPLGVILMVYEARPHVSINAGAFCLKSGNAVILRGGSEARACNALLGRLWQDSLEEERLPAGAIQSISGSHEQIGRLLDQADCIDLVIPRGGRSLVEAVERQSKVPVLKHFAGVCHAYLDHGADLRQAIDIVLDSKCLMPEVCNALETVLVAEGQPELVHAVVDAFGNAGVAIRGCPQMREIRPDVEPADESDWDAEYLDMIVSMRIVDGVDAAIDHINHYGSHHTDTIVTPRPEAAERFVRCVDSAVVLVNASTMFCDGASLGMGAEIGISTDKLHARGPMGLRELTSYKFVLHGDGHTMGNPGGTTPK